MVISVLHDSDGNILLVSDWRSGHPVTLVDRRTDHSCMHGSLPVYSMYCTVLLYLYRTNIRVYLRVSVSSCATASFLGGGDTEGSFDVALYESVFPQVLPCSR